MVSTRSHSVLSADAAHADIGGDVSSVAATPRRSGRLRGSGTATTPATEAPPRSSVRARRLRAIEEEPQAAQQPRAEQEVQVQNEEEAAAPASGKSRRSGRRRSAVASPAEPAPQPSPAATPAAAAAATPATAKKSAKKASAAKSSAKKAAAAAPAAVEEASADEQADEADEAEPQQQPSLKAGTAVIDLLAEEMFAALNDAFGEGAGANDASSGSSSSSESEEEEEQQQQQQQQQGPSHAAMQQGGHDQEAAAASEDSESDSEGESEGGPSAHAVPSHLRWRPDLMLPGMQQEGQPPRGGRPGSSSATAAAAAAGVHAVRRAGDGRHVAPSDDRVAHKAARKAAPDTAGRGWFDLPATEITEEVKRDLRLLRLRGALDPKAFYKKLDSTKFPKYFQMGTVVEGAADFYSGRLTNKQRKRTLTEEIMADPQLEAARKKRYTKLQDERQALSRKRSGRKTDNERKKKSHHRAKH